MRKTWIRYKATYTTWRDETTQQTFERVEASFADFAQKLEAEITKNVDFIKIANIESLGVE